MIHHISFPVINPYQVAKALAEIFNGRVESFPPNPNSFIVLAGDEYGTAIEVYPLGSEILPGQAEEQASFRQDGPTTAYSAIHAAISVPASLEQIKRIAEREGWRVLPCNRDGLFDVVEFWIENRLMLELLTPDIKQTYLNVTHPSNWEKSLADFAKVAVRA